MFHVETFLARLALVLRAIITAASTIASRSPERDCTGRSLVMSTSRRQVTIAKDPKSTSVWRHLKSCQLTTKACPGATRRPLHSKRAKKSHQQSWHWLPDDAPVYPRSLAGGTSRLPAIRSGSKPPLDLLRRISGQFRTRSDRAKIVSYVKPLRIAWLRVAKFFVITTVAVVVFGRPARIVVDEP